LKSADQPELADLGNGFLRGLAHCKRRTARSIHSSARVKFSIEFAYERRR
jgi:hypothetical protein